MLQEMLLQQMQLVSPQQETRDSSAVTTDPGLPSAAMPAAVKEEMSPQTKQSLRR